MGGKGIGKTLLEKISNAYPGETQALDVQSLNLAAVGLYKKMNFVISESKPGLYAGSTNYANGDAYLMIKSPSIRSSEGPRKAAITTDGPRFQTIQKIQNSVNYQNISNHLNTKSAGAHYVLVTLLMYVATL